MVHPLSPPADVLLQGTVFLDIVFTGLPQPPTPGEEIWTDGMGSSPGGIANLAVAAARLGMRTSLAACLSDDGYGQWCQEVLAHQEGIDLSLSQVCPGWHSPVTVSLAYHNDRAMITHGHDDPIGPRDLIGQPTPPRAILADLEEDPWWRGVASDQTKVFLDTGWDPSGQWDRNALDNLDGAYAFTPNMGEAQAYTRTDSPQAALLALVDRVPLPVVTMGHQGAIAWDAETGRIVEVGPLPVNAIDPTGAGDVFAAGLVCASLAGWPVEQRLLFATLCSSLAVQQFGGSLAAPGWGDIADWWDTIKHGADDDPAMAEIRHRYEFLADALRTHTRRAVRRADATIARFSDLYSSSHTASPNTGTYGRTDHS